MIQEFDATTVGLSPFNGERRKHITAAKIAAIAESMKELGQLQAGIVRMRSSPLACDPQYFRIEPELVVGEARLMACRLLDIPFKAEVRDMSDREACAAILAENLDRGQPSPVEEAATYRDMLAAVDSVTGELLFPNVEELARLRGDVERCTATIRNRLLLLQAPADVLRALEEGKVPLRWAERIAREPEAVRDEIARMALRPPGREDVPLTLPELIAMIEEKFRASLKGVAWDLTDESLEGGACVLCENRLASRGGGSAAGSCLNVACFRKKTDEAARKLAANADALGQRVMPLEKAKELLKGYDRDEGLWRLGDELYIAQDERPGHAHTRHFDNGVHPTWGELLEGMEPSWIIVKVGRASPRFFLENALAVQLAEKKRLAQSVPEGEVRPASLFHHEVIGQISAAVKAEIVAGKSNGKIKWPEWAGLFERLRDEFLNDVSADVMVLLMQMAMRNAASTGCLEPVAMAICGRRDADVEAIMTVLDASWSDCPGLVAMALCIVAMDAELFGKGDVGSLVRDLAQELGIPVKE